LKYMNAALCHYENEKRVMHICGFIGEDFSDEPGTVLASSANVWGWGSWKDRWQFYNNNAEELLEQLTQKRLLKKFDFNGSGRILPELIKNIEGTMSTWAVKWNASIHLQNGLCLYPCQSLVRNIGMDGTGVHCRDDETPYHNRQLARHIVVSDIPIKESHRFWKKNYWYYRIGVSEPSFAQQVKYYGKKRFEKLVCLLQHLLPGSFYTRLKGLYRRQYGRS